MCSTSSSGTTTWRRSTRSTRARPAVPARTPTRSTTSRAEPRVPVTDVEVLLARARDLARGERRTILGVAGPPGGGKSTLAHTVVAAVGAAAALVPMDGFHLAQAELVRLGRRDRMGAPDTFDALGYIALLRRLREPTEAVVYAPEFRRAIEEPIAGAAPRGGAAPPRRPDGPPRRRSRARLRPPGRFA